jgi:ribosomal protein L7/L12
MHALLAVLEFSDYAIIGAMIAILAGGAAYTSRQEINLAVMERELRVLQQKLDALLKHQGIELPEPLPSGLSPEVERLASIPNTKIEAIKLYRQQNPGVGLAEAKAKIEAFYKDSL